MTTEQAYETIDMMLNMGRIEPKTAAAVIVHATSDIISGSPAASAA